jgi:hypothetical protein
MPWLPYREQDRVIINAHNFTPLWTPAVNGKMPVAAWVPSRDTAGNGTTTLTDLVGSNNGTLTNMDAATDWVADTDAGGVRALEFDGANDFIAITTFSLTLPYAISLWIKTTATGTRIIAEGISGTAQLFMSSGAIFMGIRDGGAAQVTGPTINNGAWRSVVAVWGSATDRRLYVDGSLVGSDADSFANGLQLSRLMSRIGNSLFFAGLTDDFRVFDQNLVLADAQSLYASGLGRGGQA